MLALFTVFKHFIDQMFNSKNVKTTCRSIVTCVVLLVGAYLSSGWVCACVCSGTVGSIVRCMEA